MDLLVLLVILPYIILWWTNRKVIDILIKKGGGGRLFGVIVTLIVGLACAYVSLLLMIGHWAIGLAGLVMVLFILVTNIWRSLTMSKEKLEQEEQTEIEKEKRKEEIKQQIKETLEKILEKGTVDEEEYYNLQYKILIPSSLSENEYDRELRELLSKVEKLRRDRVYSNIPPYTSR